MKSNLAINIILPAFLFLLVEAPLARAYYDPGIQRWINRDPIGEPGFEALAGRATSLFAGDANRYRFVGNAPVVESDYWGLDNPGCDLPSWLKPTGANRDCYLRCCAQHDSCYFKHNCTAASWGFNVGEVAGSFGGPIGEAVALACSLSPCAGCNNAVVACFARCASGVLPPQGPRWFCPNGLHRGEFYDNYDDIPPSCWENGIRPKQ